MTYKNMFNENAEYQEILGTFNRKKAKLELMAQQGLYKKEHLQEVAQKLQDELQQNVSAFNQSKLDRLYEEKKAMESRISRVGYADRPDDVKEFEMRFKLASKHELEDMVQDLDTADLLEVNLLRSELKDRKLEELDGRVERYAAMNLVGLAALGEEGKKNYEDVTLQIGSLSTLGNGYLVTGDELMPLDQLGRELMQTASSAVNDKTVIRDVDISTF